MFNNKIFIIMCIYIYTHNYVIVLNFASSALYKHWICQHCCLKCPDESIMVLKHLRCVSFKLTFFYICIKHFCCNNLCLAFLKRFKIVLYCMFHCHECTSLFKCCEAEGTKNVLFSHNHFPFCFVINVIIY